MVPMCRDMEVLGVVTSSRTQTQTHTHTCRFTQRASHSHSLVRLPLWSFNLHGSTLILQSCSSLFHSGDPGGKCQSKAGHVDYCLFGIKSWEVSARLSSLCPLMKTLQQLHLLCHLTYHQQISLNQLIMFYTFCNIQSLDQREIILKLNASC